MEERLKSSSDHTSTNQHIAPFGGFETILYLAQLDLARVGGEEEHDGKACQKAGILDGKGE